MRKTVLTFGLIAGAVLSLMMLATVPFMDEIGFDRGLVVGYTSMVLGFLLVYFGIRSYRDNVGGGRVGFGRALAIGTLIVVIASVCYSLTWQVISRTMARDHMEKYSAYVVEQERAKGASEEAIGRKRAEMAELTRQLQNPFVSFSLTLLEPLPVGLLIALISAGVLSRRRGDARLTTGGGATLT